MSRILITAFEPFGGAVTNCTQMVAESLEQRHIEDLDVHTRLLPVTCDGGPNALRDALQSVKPDAVLATGEAERRSHVDVERVALNLMDYRIPDNAGAQPTDTPIDADGVPAYFATFDARGVRDAIRTSGVPAELSNDAGLFLCNHVSYILLEYATRCGLPAGFLHLPLVREQHAENRPRSSDLPLDALCDGVLAAARFVARQAAGASGSAGM